MFESLCPIDLAAPDSPYALAFECVAIYFLAKTVVGLVLLLVLFALQRRKRKREAADVESTRA